jgi:hypothetical protein
MLQVAQLSSPARSTHGWTPPWRTATWKVGAGVSAAGRVVLQGRICSTLEPLPAAGFGMERVGYQASGGTMSG